MSEEQLSKSKKAATKAVNSVKNRHTSNFAARVAAGSIADPDEEEGSDEECGELELWHLLPQLKDLLEAWIKKLPISAMFQLNTTLAKENKPAEKLGVNSRWGRTRRSWLSTPPSWREDQITGRTCVTLPGSWKVPAARCLNSGQLLEK